MDALWVGYFMFGGRGDPPTTLPSALLTSLPRHERASVTSARRGSPGCRAAEHSTAWRQQRHLAVKKTGWWYTYPSEKYESQLVL